MSDHMPHCPGGKRCQDWPICGHDAPEPKVFGPCGHCGRPDVGSYTRGFGYANEAYLCHPNDDGPDCYHLVTVYKHETPCIECPGIKGRA